MTIATQRSTLYRTLLLLGLSSLVACGGGGGGGGTTPGTSSKAAESSLSSNVASSVLSGVASSIVATSSSSSSSSSSVLVVDTSPAVFNFAPTTDVALSTAITSPAITLSGFDVAVPISITNGEYSINGGAFTSAAGTISPAQTLVVKVTSSNTNSTAVTTTLTVGGVSATYTVTTLADAIPDAFSFTPATNVEPESTSTSNAITVSGIEVATAISITGGEYSINGGAFTSVAGTVTNGQTVAVKAVAPAGTELTQNAVVTVGGVSSTYAVTTVPDTTAPVAEFKFPTPYTMSEAMSVKVRGTATDDHAITSVKVMVRSFDLSTPDVTISSTEIDVTPKADGDYSSWTVDVPLTALAENEIKIVAMDDRNNSTVIEAANEIVIRQADVKSAFPDAINQLDYPESLVLDKYDGRNRALVPTSSGGLDEKVIAIDLATGSRSVAFATPDCKLNGLTIDPIAKHIYGACDGGLYEFNLSDGNLINHYNINGPTNTIPAIALDRNNGHERLILLERKEYSGTGGIFSFALDTKTFSTISAADQLPPFEIGESILLDGDFYLVPGSDLKSEFGGQIISVNALDGTRKVISDNSIGAGDLYGGSDYFDMPFLTAIVKDPRLNRLFVFEYWSSRIFTVDLETFNRKIFSDISYVQPGITRTYVGSIDMEFDETQEYIFVADAKRQSIIIVDIETGEKIILSKSKNNN